MATINLLPWRDEYRQEKKNEFLLLLGVFAVLALVMAYLWYAWMDMRLENQYGRNAIFDKEIAGLNAQVKEIQKLKSQRASLESKIEVIQSLQNKRPLIVYYFSEMVKSVPNGVHFTQLDRKGESYHIRGVTESNNRVSALMRNLDKSEFFVAPNLKNVVKEKFSLVVKADVPETFSAIEVSAKK